MSPLRRNAIANVVGRASAVVLWVLITPYVLERLGAEGFGIWTLFFAFSGYLTTLNFGVGNAMLRFVARERAAEDRKSIQRILQRGLTLALGLGLLWALAVGLGREWIVDAFRVPVAMAPETHDALLVFAVGILLAMPMQALNGALQGFERLDLSNLCLFLGVMVHVTLLYLGLERGGGLIAVAFAGVVGQAVSGLLAALMIAGLLRSMPAGPAGPGPTWRDLVGYGAALQLIDVLSVVQLEVGKIVLGLLGTLAMVADYGIAFRVASGAASIPFLILAALLPVVSRVWQSHGPSGVSGLYTPSLRWLYTHSVIVLGTLWLLAPDITRIWLGPRHDHIAGLIRLWAVAYAVNLAWAPAAVVARGIGKPWIEVWSLGASVLVNVLLGVWLVPRFGTAGAIGVMALSYGVGFITFVLASRGMGVSLGPWIGRELLPRAAAAVLTVALCAGLLAMPMVSAFLPPLGWAHAALAGLLFAALFALLFLPFGDTQRFSRALWQTAMSALVRRPEAHST